MNDDFTYRKHYYVPASMPRGMESSTGCTYMCMRDVQLLDCLRCPNSKNLPIHDVN